MPTLPILTYHRLLVDEPSQARDPKRIAVSQAQFRRHCAWLSRLGYRTVSLDTYAQDLQAGKLPARKTFAITFDDGYEDVFTLAWPVLKEFGFTATIFAVPGELGGCNTWDGGHAKLLSANQYRTLDQAGLTIGAHTSHHVHLPDVAPDLASKEIRESKTALETLLGHPVRTFAYPYGEYNPVVEKLVEEAGFDVAFATDQAPVDHADAHFKLRRAVVFPRTNSWEILWKAQPWFGRYQDWKRNS